MSGITTVINSSNYILQSQQVITSSPCIGRLNGSFVSLDIGQ